MRTGSRGAQVDRWAQAVIISCVQTINNGGSRTSLSQALADCPIPCRAVLAVSRVTRHPHSQQDRSEQLPRFPRSRGRPLVSGHGLYLVSTPGRPPDASEGRFGSAGLPPPGRRREARSLFLEVLERLGILERCWVHSGSCTSASSSSEAR